MKKTVWILTSLFLITSFFLISCGKKKEEVESSKEISKITEEIEPAGPLKIVSHGPTGETKGQVQIEIDFANPLIPLATLSDVEREQILQHFVLEPAVEGEFRLLGTSAVVFEPVHSLPMASMYKVTVTKGLRDIREYELEEDYTWEFQTPLPQIKIYPPNGDVYNLWSKRRAPGV